MNAIDRLSDTQRRLVEKVLYVLFKVGGLEYYHLFKVLYLADCGYQQAYSRKLIEDNFCTLRRGLVPSDLYSAIKARGKETLLSQALWEVVETEEDDKYTLYPLREADVNYIDELEASTLDKYICMLL